MKISVTSVFVDDPLKAFKFYTEVLGFRERLFMPEANLAIVASPEDPEGTGLLLEPNDNPVAKTYQEGLYKTGLPVIVFSVPDVPREYERLSRAGVVFRQPPTPTEAGLAAVFDDTCGNFIELFQG